MKNVLELILIVFRKANKNLGIMSFWSKCYIINVCQPYDSNNC